MILGEGASPVSVRWFFVRDGAEWLGVPNAFTLSSWDSDAGLGAPPIGDQGPPSPWDRGVNTGNYTGLCRVGTDDEWLNGVDPLSPPAPPCGCQEQPPGVVTLYLRSDQGPHAAHPPAGVVGPWSNVGGFVTQLGLYPFPGTGVRQQLSNFTVHGPESATTCRWQYVGGVVGPGLLRAATWSIDLGGVLTLHASPISSFQFRWSVSICDSTGALKQVLAGPTLWGPAIPAVGHYYSRVVTFPVPDITFAAGDYLVVELGEFQSYSAHIPTRWTWLSNDCGTTPITGPDVGQFNPAALLSYPSL